MSDAWTLIAVAGIAAIGILYLRSRKAGGGRIGGAGRVRTPADRAGSPAARNFTQERDDDRHARMSDEDRTWEAASLQRSREPQARDDTPTEQGAPLR